MILHFCIRRLDFNYCDNFFSEEAKPFCLDFTVWFSQCSKLLCHDTTHLTASITEPSAWLCCTRLVSTQPESCSTLASSGCWCWGAARLGGGCSWEQPHGLEPSARCGTRAGVGAPCHGGKLLLPSAFSVGLSTVTFHCCGSCSLDPEAAIHPQQQQERDLDEERRTGISAACKQL